MGELTMHPQVLREAGDDCRVGVVPWVRLARRAFDAGVGVCGDSNGVLRSSAAADACVSTWRGVFGDGVEKIGGVGDKLSATAAAVRSGDSSAVELYTGVTSRLPAIDLDLGDG